MIRVYDAAGNVIETHDIVGPKGKVIGVDMTDEMLEVAWRNAPVVAERIGYENVEFRKGRIQDLALDLEELDRQLKRSPITNATSFVAADALAEELSRRLTQTPLQRKATSNDNR